MIFKYDAVLQDLEKILLITMIFINLSGVNSQKVSDWGLSEVNVKELTYAWKIKNFTTLREFKADKLMSPRFPEHERRENQFRLAFLNENAGIFENLFLLHEGDIIGISYNIKILNNNNEEVKEWLGIIKEVDNHMPLLILTKIDHNLENEFIILANLKIYKSGNISGDCKFVDEPQDVSLCNVIHEQ